MLRFLTNSEMGHIATDFEPQLTYQMSKNCYKNMVVGSFWKDFDVKLSQKWFKSGFERHRLQKTGLKLTFLSFREGTELTHFRTDSAH